jgi:hypothetical protein
MILENIRDFKTIGKAFIHTLNGVMAITLTALAGTIDTNDVDSNRLLKNLSISFGATIAGMQLLLAFGLEVIIAKSTSTIEEEEYVKKLLEDSTSRVERGNEFIGKVINEMKKSSAMSTADKDKIELLEAAFNTVTGEEV